MKLAVNTTVILGVAVVFLGLVYLLLMDLDVIGHSLDLNDKLMGTIQAQDYKKVDMIGFIVDLQKYWEKCRQDKVNSTIAFLVNDEGYLTKEAMFSIMKEMQWCHKLQSKQENCGLREDITYLDNLSLPQIFVVNCTPTSLEIRGV